MHNPDNYNRSLDNFSEQPEFKNNHLISRKTADKSQNFLEISFEPKTVFKIFCLIIFCLVSINTLAQVSKYTLAGGTLSRVPEKLTALFALNVEANIPTMYSSFALLLCCLLLAIIAKSKYREGNRYRFHWKYLSLIFLYLAIDEGVQIHELSVGTIRRLFNTSGFFAYAWVIPAIILFSLFALIYLKFVFSLPQNIRFLFILAAVFFVGGALGMEMIGANFAQSQSQNNLTYAMITTVEEALEMFGIAIFIYALLKYIQNYVDPLKISF